MTAASYGASWDTIFYLDINALQSGLATLITAYNTNVPLTQKEIDDLRQTMNLLSTATAKLITVQGTMGQAIDNNEGATQVSLTDLNQSLVSLQQSLDTIYAEAATLKAKIDANQTDVTSEQAKFAAAFDTFTSDTKANYGVLVNAVNNLNEQASEQKARTDTVMKIAIAASVVAVISLAFAIILFVKGLSVKR
jgi:5'-3' exonuclease